MSLKLLGSVLITAVLCGGEVWAEAPPAGAKQALLIGCTAYPHCKGCPELTGPHNDIPLLARVLTERFGFDDAHITRLVGWPDEPEKRPTYQNIVNGFERLIQDAKPGTQVVILMCGHGTQVPIPASQTDPLDPRNPEPDGLDEVFLPADVKSWSEEGLVNAIRDDQIGGWLDQLKAKGAAVWILFDCCHSGTMSRGEATPDETYRGTSPESVGIPTEILQSAQKRAASAVQKTPTKGERATVDVNGSKAETGSGSETGSVTAFFAAQSYEEAPELYRPAHAPRKPENTYGLMTYVIAQTLLSQDGKRSPTYRELSHAMVTRYRAERGSRGPTPMFDGQLDREVLGLKDWPARSELRLEKFESELRIPGGALRGLTPGTILRVVPPGADPKGEKVLGHVRVTNVTAVAAVVEPCEFRDLPAPEADTLPALAPCAVVYQDLGEMRVSIRVRESTRPDLANFNTLLKETADKLATGDGAFVTLARTAEAAAWELRVVTPQEALLEFRVKLTRPEILLLKAPDIAVGKLTDRSAKTAPAQDQAGDETAAPATKVKPLVEAPLRLVRRYRGDDPQVLVDELSQDFQKIYTWQNVWRVANATGGASGGGTSDPAVKFEVAAIKSETDSTGGEVLKDSKLQPGQYLEVRIKNESIENQWITLLFLGGDFSITVLTSGGLQEGEKFRPFRCEIDDTSVGIEGFVVLAVPMSRQKAQPDYGFLKQLAIGEAQAGTRAGFKVPQTPFGKLLAATVLGKGTRGAEPDAPDNPEIHTWSWVTVPAAK